MNKLRLWETEWNAKAEEASREQPLKSLTALPQIPGITAETAKRLTWKSLKYLLKEDDGTIRSYLRKHPLRYGLAYLRSWMRGKPYKRDGDFFLYGIATIEAFEKLLQKSDTLLVIGFSYCHKPFECPSGRFTDQCARDFSNPVCRQCFIGKCVQALPSTGCVPLFIPTIHYIGGKIFELQEQYPDKQLLFMITACELTLEMFGHLGNMVGIQGVGVRLDGRICNTMKAFELSEAGIKPGLTVVLKSTQERILDLIFKRSERS